MASEEFRDAALVQGEALGYPARVVYVPHPIQDRTDDEMRAMAGEVFANVLALVAQGEN